MVLGKVLARKIKFKTTFTAAVDWELGASSRKSIKLMSRLKSLLTHLLAHVNAERSQIILKSPRGGAESAKFSLCHLVRGPRSEKASRPARGDEYDPSPPMDFCLHRMESASHDLCRFSFCIPLCSSLLNMSVLIHHLKRVSYVDVRFPGWRF